jgi:hypothetical protein
LIPENGLLVTTEAIMAVKSEKKAPDMGGHDHGGMSGEMDS